MKQNDTGDFCILYIEPADDRPTVLQAIAEQKKPVVIMLGEQAHVFQHPDDFTVLKHARRQLDLPIVFVIPRGERLTQLAGRNGFPVYLSMDALADALAVGQLTRQRVLSRAAESRTTGPLANGSHSGPVSLNPARPLGLARKTVPLVQAEPQERPARKTEPLASPPAARTAYTPPQPLPPLPQLASQPLAYVPSPQTRATYAPPQLHIIPEPFAQARQTGASGELPPAPPERKRRKVRRSVAILCILAALAVAGISSGVILLLVQNAPAAPAAPTVVGRISFVSSQQVSENSNQGIADEVQLSLSHLSSPASGKSYYAWLLGDKNQVTVKPILLGTLQIHSGSASLLYPGDSQHTNLLAGMSRFLVTEEDATMPPVAPSPDESTWRYYGEFLQMPMGTPTSVNGVGQEHQYSYLDHLRHLLAADPMLDTLELPGGLSNWLYTNVSKIFEWTGSTREHWEETREIGFIRRQMIRTLAYLDGLSYLQQDLPPGTQLNMNERLARIGILRVSGPNQDPPAYIDHIVFHLSGLIQAGGMTPELRTRAAAIITALNNVDFWLQRVRRDASQIMKMTDVQLQQPQTLSLLDDMITNANSSYVGMNDPAGGPKMEGVTWIHDQIQSLATLDVTTYKGAHSQPQTAPGTSTLV